MCYGLSEHLWINVDYNIFMLAFAYNPGNEFQKGGATDKNEEENKNTAPDVHNQYFKDQKSYNRYLNRYLKEKRK